MDEPLVIAAIVSMVGLTLTALITGIFACFKVRNGGGAACASNGLLAALTAQTKAMGDLIGVLREAHIEDRQAHEKMVEALTILVERTKG